MSSEENTQIVGSGYLVTLQGICKIVEVVASFIGVLLVGINFWGSAVSVFESAAIISIIVAVFLLIIYSTGAVGKMQLAWNRIQFFFHVILAIYYIIAVGLVFHYGSGWSRIIAGGVFGLIATVAHLIDGVDNYRKQPLC